MTIKRTLIYSWCVLVIACVLLLGSLYTVYNANQQNTCAYDERETAQILSLELRDSSKNLTEAVRQYAVTGDSKFENAYWDIVKIRSGEIPRPADRKVAPGRSVALLTLMEEAGFTSEELEYLKQANDFSNALIALETQAMMAVKGRFLDSTGQYSKTGPADREMATNLVFSEQYQKEVQHIMEPIAKFQKSLEARVGGLVAESELDYNRHFILLAASVVSIVALVIVLLVMLYKVVIRPILICDSFAKQVADGNLESTLGYSSQNEIGSLANALRTMVKSLQERIRLAEEANKNAEEGLRQAKIASEEASRAQKLAEDGRRTLLRTAEQVEELVGRLSAATEELSAQVEESSQSAVHQDQLVLEAATAMEEMNSTVLSVAKNASSVASGSEKARNTANEGAGW